MRPQDELSSHFRLVPTQKIALKKLGISTVKDLLYHFPTRYDQSGSDALIAGLTPGTKTIILGTIEKLDTRRSWKRKIPVGEATIRDATGSIKIMWFHQPYLAKKFSEGQFVKAIGTVAGKNRKLYLANPDVTLADPTNSGLFKSSDNLQQTTNSLSAVYPESRGATSLWFRHAQKRAFQHGAHTLLKDPIPEDILRQYHLPSLTTALTWIHAPENLKHAEAARKRFAFEEIFALQVLRAKKRAENNTLSSFSIPDAMEHAQRFLASLKVSPTNAQRRAVNDVLIDFGKQHPMARLLEGDVGSGKTLVAATTAYAVVNSRPPKRTSGTLQVAYMAPTEILAAQHFQTFVECFSHLPINIALITGKMCKKFPSKILREKATDISRAQLLKWVASGEIAMIVGTHALIQKSVRFQHLAYVIVDEQHRFGTVQRRALAHKDDTSPHFLSMTATPIPRTLALTIYGDLDISVLDELPPGRAPATTTLVKPHERNTAYQKMREELDRGRQAYVICPRIEEPDPKKWGALQAKSAKTEAKRLKKETFPEYEIGLLHGAMKTKEKDLEMSRFASGKTHILVATSVVEVGVNVPNATTILIEGAERFGLAQLHQLRGRVMRSSHKPHCFLLPEISGEVAIKRLKAIAGSDDGFTLAEADLEARGSGDLYGRNQWGVSDIAMEALKNPRLIEAARLEAQKLIAYDPTLTHHPILERRIEHVATNLHSE